MLPLFLGEGGPGASILDLGLGPGASILDPGLGLGPRTGARIQNCVIPKQSLCGNHAVRGGRRRAGGRVDRRKGQADGRSGKTGRLKMINNSTLFPATGEW